MSFDMISHGLSSFTLFHPTYCMCTQPLDIIYTYVKTGQHIRFLCSKVESRQNQSLLVRAKGCESKFIIRGLQGKLRIGVSESTVLTSLAHAIVLTKPKDVVELSDERLAEIRKLDGTDGKFEGVF